MAKNKQAQKEKYLHICNLRKKVVAKTPNTYIYDKTLYGHIKLVHNGTMEVVLLSGKVIKIDLTREEKVKASQLKSNKAEVVFVGTATYDKHNQLVSYSNVKFYEFS